MKNKYQRVLDIGILILLFIVSKVPSAYSIVNKIDELIFLYMSIVIISRMLLLKSRNLFFPYLIVSFVGYSIFLLLYNRLPYTHLLQVFISLKFLIIFLYFYTTTHEHKNRMAVTLTNTIIIVFLVSLLFTILQFSLPAYFSGYSPDGRGLMGINAGGIFFNRIGYSAFLITFLIVLMSLRAKSNKLIAYTIQFRYMLLLLTLILLSLTFARKEMVLGFALLLYLFKDKIHRDSKIVFYMFLFAIISVFALAFYFVFQDLNSATFTTKQVRYLIFLNAIDIFYFYFPFGSGPGTFGSIMSIDYQVIYEKFNVPRHIYLGYGGTGRGPIFDLFLVSMLAEYGLGIIFILSMLYKIGLKRFNKSIDSIINTTKAKKALIIQVVVIAFFVPILLNWNGYIIFAMLGVMSSKKKVF